MSQAKAFAFTADDQPREARSADVLGELLGGTSPGGRDPRGAAVLRLVERAAPVPAREPAGPRPGSREHAKPVAEKKSRRESCYLTPETAGRLAKAKADIGRRLPGDAAARVSKSGIMGLCLEMLLKDFDRRGPMSVLFRACAAKAGRGGR